MTKGTESFGPTFEGQTAAPTSMHSFVPSHPQTTPVPTFKRETYGPIIKESDIPSMLPTTNAPTFEGETYVPTLQKLFDQSDSTEITPVFERETRSPSVTKSFGPTFEEQTAVPSEPPITPVPTFKEEIEGLIIKEADIPSVLPTTDAPMSKDEPYGPLFDQSMNPTTIDPTTRGSTEPMYEGQTSFPSSTMNSFRPSQPLETYGPTIKESDILSVPPNTGASIFYSPGPSEASSTLVLSGGQSAIPSVSPSVTQSIVASGLPSKIPSSRPSFYPSTLPSQIPSSDPSSKPSTAPSVLPSSQPSFAPSFTLPSEEPSFATICPASEVQHEMSYDTFEESCGGWEFCEDKQRFYSALSTIMEFTQFDTKPRKEFTITNSMARLYFSFYFYEIGGWDGNGVGGIDNFSIQILQADIEETVDFGHFHFGYNEPSESNLSPDGLIRWKRTSDKVEHSPQVLSDLPTQRHFIVLEIPGPGFFLIGGKFKIKFLWNMNDR